MNNTKQLWEQVLSHIKENVTPISYDTFLEPLNLHSIDEHLKIAYVESKDDFKNRIC